MNFKPVLPVKLILISFFMLFNEQFHAQDYIQGLFNNYHTLCSRGDLPADFSSRTYEKIKEELAKRQGELSDPATRIFLNEINYEVDNLLHSGKVVYGDQVSLYISEIADLLLAKEPDLRAKLRFYTIKSNETNAFSTDQGIIFVTTGLLTQLTNEAQLAYILSHEIAHYTEKHVIQTFKINNTTLKDKDHIRELSIYSKEKEFEADKLGLKRYYDAGYSEKELMTVFDVLLYSYLPFEEVEFPKTHFNTQQMYIPESLFPENKRPITAIEDYDDSKSSHPNIKKRKQETEKEILLLKDWGTRVFALGEAKFNLIRTICRFESIRIDVIEGNFTNAFYSIFLLEKDFPDAIYLKRMKAQSWLGLAQLAVHSGTRNSARTKMEGEISVLGLFLNKLNKDGIVTMALRQVYDIYKASPNDKEIKAIYLFFLQHLVSTDYFHPPIYTSYNFSTAAELDLVEKSKAKDSIPNASPVENKESSKYDKIKTKRNEQLKSLEFDSAQFYRYSISDIIADPQFKSFSDSFKKAADSTKTASEQSKIALNNQLEHKLFIGEKEFIVVEPLVFCYKKEDFNLVKSEKLRIDFSEAIAHSAVETKVITHMIDRNHVKDTFGTTIFNERSTLFAFLTQTPTINYSVFPADYEEIQYIQLKYNTSNILFTLVEHEYKQVVLPSILLLPFYPVASFVIPIMALRRNDTDMRILILNLEESKITTGYNYSFHDKPRKYSLGAHMYHIFQSLSTNPSDHK